jgi:hypothetical protein
MICTECHATIADKAIVCYRCGAPTTIPGAEKRPAPSRRSAGPLGAIVLLLLAALAGVLSVVFDPETYARLGSMIVAVVLMLASVILFARRGK